MATLKVNKNFSIGKEGNFWTLNPGFIIINPYNELYNSDSSKDKENSSRVMWSVVFTTDPDKDENPFYNRTEEEAKKELEQFYVSPDLWQSELFIKCKEHFKEYCLTPIARALKDELESMMGRAKMLRETAYTLDETVDGKLQKGTATQLDAMRKATPALLKTYQQLEADYLVEKSTLRSKGDRKLTKSEKGDLW